MMDLVNLAEPMLAKVDRHTNVGVRLPELQHLQRSPAAILAFLPSIPVLFFFKYRCNVRRLTC